MVEEKETSTEEETGLLEGFDENFFSEEGKSRPKKERCRSFLMSCRSFLGRHEVFLIMGLFLVVILVAAWGGIKFTLPEDERTMNQKQETQKAAQKAAQSFSSALELSVDNIYCASNHCTFKFEDGVLKHFWCDEDGCRPLFRGSQ